MTITNSHYIHGSTSEEQNRLSLLNDLLNKSYLEKIEPAGAKRILDVGCGLGQFSRMLAKSASEEAVVVGIERDEQQIAMARNLAEADHEDQLMDLRQGEVSRFPLAQNEWGSFDLAHGRFILEHVPNPQAVVDQMIQALKPGGKIVLADDDHADLHLYPEIPEFCELWQAYIKSYELSGNDPFIGRKLPQLIVHAGGVMQKIDFVFFGACHGSPHFKGIVDNFHGVLKFSKQTILDQGLFTNHRLDKALERLLLWAERPDAALWYPMYVAIGARPGHL